MKNNKIGKIVKYNIEKNLRNRWFIGLNILLFIGTLVALNFTTVKGIISNSNIISSNKHIQVKIEDETDIFYNEFINSIKDKEEYNKLKVEQVNEIVYDENLEKDIVLIKIENSKDNIINAKVVSRDGIDNKYYDIVQNCLNNTKNEIIITKYNISPEQIDNIKKDVDIERVMVGVDNSNSDIKQIAQTVVSYITLIILMLILSKIATDVSQEKLSKSIEYVLTSISAKEYLVAKIISISLTMIIQLVFTFVYFLISSSTNSILNMIFNSNIDLSGMSDFSLSSIASMLDSSMLLYIFVVFVFLILTVFLMCIIQAALTSKTTNISEAGNTTTILLTINLVLYITSTFVITPLKQTSIVIYILSCIPIISMYFVPSMIIIGQVNIFQIIASTVLLIASIPFSLKICSKIFKDGVLDNVTKKKKIEKNIEVDVKIKEINKIKKMELSKYGFVIGMSVILYVVVQFVLTYSLSIFITPIHNALAGKVSIDIIEMIVNIIVFAGALSIPAIFVLSYIEKENKDNNKEKINNNLKEKTIDTLKLVLMCSPIIFVVQIGLGILLEKLGLNYDIVDKVDLYNGSTFMSKLLFFVYISVMPAIFEELYIRKAVINFSKKYGNIFAVISSAILFAVLHLNISQSLFAFIMGVILGIVAIKSKSIIPTAIIHFLNNGYAALTLIFENNNIALVTINVLYIIMFTIGFILLVLYIIKNNKEFKKIILKLKSSLKRKEIKYINIAIDYTFIIACILMLVMLVLTQKTLEIL